MFLYGYAVDQELYFNPVEAHSVMGYAWGERHGLSISTTLAFFSRNDNIDVTYYKSRIHVWRQFTLQCNCLHLHLGVKTPIYHKGLCHHLSFWFTFWRVPEHCIEYIDILEEFILKLKADCTISLQSQICSWILIHAYWNHVIILEEELCISLGISSNILERFISLYILSVILKEKIDMSGENSPTAF
jgi:hypothetical protein